MMPLSDVRLLLQTKEVAEQAKQRTAEAVQYGKETVDQTADQVLLLVLVCVLPSVDVDFNCCQ